MINTYAFVSGGPAVHDSPGKTLPRYIVFSNGMSPPGANAGDVTVSFAVALAGSVTIASWAPPTSVGRGGCWASRTDGARRAKSAPNPAGGKCDLMKMSAPHWVEV